MNSVIRQVHSELLQMMHVRMGIHQHECRHDDNAPVYHAGRISLVCLVSSSQIQLRSRCTINLICSTATPEARAARARCYAGWDVGDVGADWRLLLRVPTAMMSLASAVCSIGICTTREHMDRCEKGRGGGATRRRRRAPVASSRPRPVRICTSSRPSPPLMSGNK